MEKRIFEPRKDLINTLRPACLPWVGKEVNVISWHPLMGKETKKLFPKDKKVGFVQEFLMDIPESELI